jgi:hypothetical protein
LFRGRLLDGYLAGKLRSNAILDDPLGSLSGDKSHSGENHQA